MSAVNAARSVFLEVAEPLEGEKVDNAHRGKHDYDLFIRARGTSAWAYGVTAHNPAAAVYLQSTIRLQRPYIDVKVLRKPKGDPS
jgi:hypothetical protein